MIELPFNSIEFAEAWSDFIEMKKEVHKFEYKSERSMKAVFKKLIRESHNNEEIAVAMLENAIAEEWKGFHPLKWNDPLIIKLKNIKVNKPQTLADKMRQDYGITSS